MMRVELPKILTGFMEGQSLGFYESYQLMHYLMEERCTPSQIGAILYAYGLKGESPPEIAGFAVAMKEKATPFPVVQKTIVIDNCGTGGDGKRTFNLSTASALIAYTMGLKIVKHGNRSVTSSCGSADFLEALGFRVDLPVDKMKQYFDQTGFAFLYAPLYHPAMKVVQQVRKELGIRTIFNLLGPLTNPAPVTHKVIGVYRADLVEVVAQAMVQTGIRRGLVCWGEPGIDEVSICGPTKIASIEEERIKIWDFNPEQIGLKPESIHDLVGGSPEENVRLFYGLLQREKPGGALEKAVILNTAFLLWLVHPEMMLRELYHSVENALNSGRVLERVQNLVSINQNVAG